MACRSMDTPQPPVDYRSWITLSAILMRQLTADSIHCDPRIAYLITMRTTLAFGLLASASLVSSHPAPSTGRRSFGPYLQRRAVDLNSFRLKPVSTYVNATQVEVSPEVSTIVKRADYVSTASELVSKLSPSAEFRIVGDHYVGTNGIAHVNVRQTANGLNIDNADYNINIDTDGSIFSYGGSFHSGAMPATAAITRRDLNAPVRALRSAKATLDLPVFEIAASASPIAGDETYTISGISGTQRAPEAKLVYLQTAQGLKLTWRIETDILSNWLLTYVDATNMEQVHAVVDYSADASYDASYQVYPWGINDPTEAGRSIQYNPWDDESSEFGWHSDGLVLYNTTRGNNGIAQVNPNNTATYLDNYRPVNPSLDFVYPYSTDLTVPKSYWDASITQLFYTANRYHDLLHQLGFVEAAGNFEVNNNGQGGLGNDSVILNAKDGSGVNNANFATPPDGQSGRMRMYIWNYTMPLKDCSFEAGVVIHEYTHGVSNRLTGGPANSRCLSVLESGGMGEGWGDFMATAIRLKPGDTRKTDYPMGAWVYSKAAGIRKYPYSTNFVVNPHVYTDVNNITVVHGIGTVWATMLYEVMWNLIDKHGKNDAPEPSFNKRGVPTDGRYLAMKLVIDGMALQPCNPNFIQARDAILDADRALTRGQNACEIWTGFAKRGLGAAATYGNSTRTASYVVPRRACHGHW
nr:Extracellular metalloproteinase MEP [Rachicladosporium sp. CCFEE 5018]